MLGRKNIYSCRSEATHSWTCLKSSLAMQALSCGSSSAMVATVIASRSSTALPEVEKTEVTKPSSDRVMNTVRLCGSNGTPSRVPMDSSGQRLSSTPKIVRAACGGRNPATLTPKVIRSLKGTSNQASPTPKKLQVVSETENLAPTSQEDSSGAHHLPLDTFTVYANPSFEPLETTESPSKEQKQQQQPSSIPVDSNGQKLCPTPKRTQSPGISKLGFRKATSFQPLETIQSPSVRKDQAKGVLVDSNGQRTHGTPSLSKQFTTPRERTAVFGSTCSEKLTPRALFNDGHGGAAPRSVSRVPHRAATESKPSAAGVAGTKGTPVVKRAFGSTVKKRGRNDDDAAEEDENTRVTRSKTEAERIALFLRSPAARVRPDGRKEEFWHGVSDVLLEKYTETKLMSASKPRLTHN